MEFLPRHAAGLLSRQVHDGAREAHVDPALINAVALVDSGFDERARSPKDAVKCGGDATPPHFETVANLPRALNHYRLLSARRNPAARLATPAPKIDMLQRDRAAPRAIDSVCPENTLEARL